MKFLNKLDRYLVENHPLLWMSKIHYVLPEALLVNLIFWLWGYSQITIDSLKGYINENVFINSYAIFIYMIISLIFIIIWAVSYFKKSAVRHLYPIGKFYFTRLFALLFINFSLIGLPYMSFYAGVNSKVQRLANYEELKKELEMVNLAQAFLPSHQSDFYGYEGLFEAQHPGYEILRSNFWTDNGFDKGSYNPYDHPENDDTTVNGDIVQCLKVTHVDYSCYGDYEKKFDGYLNTPIQYLRNENNINYRVDEFIDTKSYNQAPESALHYYYYYYDEISKGNLEYNKRIRAISGNPEKIKETLDKFDAFLTKYDVPHAFNSKVIAEFLVKNKGEFQNSFVNSYINYQGYSYDPMVRELEREKILKEFQLQSKNTTVKDIETIGFLTTSFLVEETSLESVFRNSKKAYYWKSMYIECLIMSFVALGLAFLFLMFSFADFITLVITIPAMGVLIIINSLICGLIYAISGTDNYLFLEPLFFAFGVIIFYLIQLKSKRASRRITHALGYVTGFISTMFVIGVIAAFGVLTQTRVYECGYYHTEMNAIMRWVEDPGFIFVTSVVGILLFTTTIKKLIAKAD